MPNLPGVRPLSQDLHADLEGRGADVVQAGLKRHHLVREDRGVEIHGIQACRHHQTPTVPHREDAAGLVEGHEHLAREHHVAEQRVLGHRDAHRFECPTEVRGVARRLGEPGFALREARQATLSAIARGRHERFFVGAARRDLVSHGAWASVLVHGHEHQMRVQRHGPAAGGDVLRPYPHADLERAGAHVLDLRTEDGDLAYFDGVEEVDVVHRAQADHPARDPRRGQRTGLRDPLHHPTAVDLPRRSGVLRKHPVDQLDRGLGDRRHMLEKTRPPER